MKRQIVVLECDYETDDWTNKVDPAEWNWGALVGEPCKVIAAGPVTEIGEGTVEVIIPEGYVWVPATEDTHGHLRRTT